LQELPQTPPLQVAVPLFGAEQTLPQNPQFVGSLPFTYVSQPSYCLLLLQSPQPLRQVPAQYASPPSVEAVHGSVWPVGGVMFWREQYVGTVPPSGTELPQTNQP
jgi:hypothetical protein